MLLRCAAVPCAELKALLTQMELNCLQGPAQQNPALLSELLSDCFVEVDEKGHRHNKQDALMKSPAVLEVKTGPVELTVLAPGVAQIHYETSALARPAVLRTSIWRYEGKSWRRCFHQGTERHACASASEAARPA